MIQGVVFDMDGLLIDSEPFWLQADLEIYESLGIDLKKHLKGETTGLRVDAAVQHWYQKFPWEGRSLADVQNDILNRVEGLIEEKGVAKEGALELIQALHQAKVPLAVCSSSPSKLIRTALKKIGVISYFSVIHSAEHESHGKPHPAAYLTTARLLEIDPTKLLVFEDSVVGAIAAKAARCQVVAVPEGAGPLSSRFDFCEQKIRSLNDFDCAYFLANRSLKI